MIVAKSTNINKTYNHLSPQIYKKTTTKFSDGNPGHDLEQATNGGYKLVHGMPTTFGMWIITDNTRINKQTHVF